MLRFEATIGTGTGPKPKTPLSCPGSNPGSDRLLVYSRPDIGDCAVVVPVIIKSMSQTSAAASRASSCRGDEMKDQNEARREYSVVGLVFAFGPDSRELCTRVFSGHFHNGFSFRLLTRKEKACWAGDGL